VKIETLLTDGVTTVVVTGEVDSAEKIQVGNTFRDLLEKGETRFIFDLGKVTYLGSSGVSCLVAFRRDAVAKSGSVALVNPPLMVRKVFKTLGLEKDFPVYGSREEALKAIKGGGKAK
jgi:anti-sigma B factor antagonist